MDYLLTEEQSFLLELFRDFAKNEVAPVSKEYDKKGEFPKELFKKAAEMGLTTLHLPEKYGGGGMNTVTQAIMVEELSNEVQRMVIAGALAKGR